MSNFIFKVTRSCARIIGRVIPWRLPEFYKSFKTHVYSAVYAKSLKGCGKDFYLEAPAVLIGKQYITIGDNFICNSRLRIEAFDNYRGEVFTPQITIGNNVGINYGCHIAGINKIIIGNNVLMGSNILITDHYHGEITSQGIKQPPAERPLFSRGAVIIEDCVWIGEGAAILPGVTIGANSIVGANSVVTKSVPANSVVGGNPARILKMLKNNE